MDPAKHIYFETVSKTEVTNLGEKYALTLLSVFTPLIYTKTSHTSVKQNSVERTEQWLCCSGMQSDERDFTPRLGEEV
jgi:hypothetical protein